MKHFSFLVPRTMMRRKQDTSENEYARQRNQVDCIIETNSSIYLKYLIYMYILRLKHPIPCLIIIKGSS